MLTKPFCLVCDDGVVIEKACLGEVAICNGVWLSSDGVFGDTPLLGFNLDFMSDQDGEDRLIQISKEHLNAVYDNNLVVDLHSLLLKPRDRRQLVSDTAQ